MTRINCIPVTELSDKHLVAEYRELPRVFGLVTKAIQRGERPDDPRNPTEYTLGKGHVRFFYPRLGYCERRFQALAQEMVRRGMKPQYGHVLRSWENVTRGFYEDWTPTPAAQALNRQRIADKQRLSRIKELLK